jgi:hypothetical protein
MIYPLVRVLALAGLFGSLPGSCWCTWCSACRS